jgi:hypothetical protein
MRPTAVIAAIVCAGSANATLIDRGNGLIYDTALDITWMQNAHAGDNMWEMARDLAASTTFAGLTGWRLPSVGPDYSFEVPFNPPPFDCSTGTAAQCAASGNELGYMYYYNLAGTPGPNKTGDQVADGVVLYDIQGEYWAGTLAYPGEFSWSFGFNGGGLGFMTGGGNTASIWLVRPGDVPQAIPEPSTTTLMALGLAAVALGLSAASSRSSRRKWRPWAGTRNPPSRRSPARRSRRRGSRS